LCVEEFLRLALVGKKPKKIAKVDVIKKFKMFDQ
jgi:hypothetical protein